MINRKYKITKNLLLHILIFALLLSFSLPALSEGSISMTSPKDNNLSYRPYSYWTNTNALGIPRQQIIFLGPENK